MKKTKEVGSEGGAVTSSMLSLRRLATFVEIYSRPSGHS